MTFTATGVGDFWTTGASMPTSRFALTVAVLNGVVYAVGGTRNAYNYLTAVEAYDPATGAWASRTPMPTTRTWCCGEAGVINGILYVPGDSDGT
ncbi:MAG TPA: kelch repeat-containing protein, partial [Gemmatimonadaceae bacterium]|nr:kelch repeat-containing protein [Gemmatimonadaceae bacterium]